MTVTIEAFATRSPPQFADMADARRHSLQRLAATCRIIGHRGLSDGLLGHVTLRDPEFADRFWVNPVGIAMDRMRVSHLVQVNHAGEVTQGRGNVNPVGLLLHTALHAARPDVAAVCHSHGLHSCAFASLGRLLEPINQDAAVFHGRQALITSPRLVNDAASAARFAAAFGDKRVAVHEGHGIFTTGQTIDEAAWWYLLMSGCCEAQLLALAAGEPSRYDDADAAWLASTIGSSRFGWLSFQVLWDAIIASDPDLVD